jgi:hypothetical protein
LSFGDDVAQAVQAMLRACGRTTHPIQEVPRS